MGSKVFISYSHTDEIFKNALIEHMAGLIRSGLISEWHDRKIIPGEDWSKEISGHLKSSDLILFLISASFIHSDYCINIEAKTALEMHQNGKAQLIPIIIRHVDWSDTEFSKLQGLPTDAKAVSSWDNQDEAWVSVIKGIKAHIKEFPIKSIVPQIEKLHNMISISEQTKVWLEDTEITLTHRKVNKINLSNIFIVPDIEIENNTKGALRIFKSAFSLKDQLEKFIVSGEEQQGKTSLLKYYYKTFFSEGILPIYLDGAKIKNSNIKEVIRKAIDIQYYNGLTYDTYINSPCIILIDNIDEISLNKKYRDIFFKNVNQLFDRCIYTSNISFSYVFNEISAFDCFEKTVLLDLGHKKREELIQRWITLGVEETISDQDLYEHCDVLKNSLNDVIRKNIVPPKPIYLLMFLQMFEAHANLNLELSSHGHCYQQLIYQSLENAKIGKQEIGKYLNILTELAWWIFINEVNPDEQQREDFFAEYCDKYLLVDSNSVVFKLTSHSVLTKRDTRLAFKYPYIYYFFVGKKIAESYNESSNSRNQFDRLLENLHREDFANIIIFVTHHTKDAWVLEKIKNVLSSLFNQHQIATLERQQLLFMDEFMKQIPDLVLEQREIQIERNKQNEILDEQERNYQEDVNEDSLDVFAKINKTFKGMEIAGQIIRNHHASLTKDSLVNLANEGIQSGLRFLKHFIIISDIAKKEIIKIIANYLTLQPTLSDNEIEKFAERAYLHLTYGVINGVVRKIATSVGSKEAMEIYSLLEKRTSIPAMQLLKQAVELHFNKRIDISSISKCMEGLKDNPVCTRILKELILQHIYMFPVPYREKQQLSNLLGLSVKTQQLIEKKQKIIGA